MAQAPGLCPRHLASQAPAPRRCQWAPGTPLLHSLAGPSQRGRSLHRGCVLGLPGHQACPAEIAATRGRAWSVPRRPGALQPPLPHESSSAHELYWRPSPPRPAGYGLSEWLHLSGRPRRCPRSLRCRQRKGPTAAACAHARNRVVRVQWHVMQLRQAPHGPPVARAAPCRTWLRACAKTASGLRHVPTRRQRGPLRKALAMPGAAFKAKVCILPGTRLLPCEVP